MHYENPGPIPLPPENIAFGGLLDSFPLNLGNLRVLSSRGSSFAVDRENSRLTSTYLLAYGIMVERESIL